jgi:hypothetical protein
VETVPVADLLFRLKLSMHDAWCECNEFWRGLDGFGGA